MNIVLKMTLYSVMPEIARIWCPPTKGKEAGYG